MALSQIQCLDDNHVNPRTHESKPEFLYCEEQRLALETLLCHGREAFFKQLEARGLRGFLSDLELEALAGNVEPFDPGVDLYHEDPEHEQTPLSLQYWPDLSDTSTPELDIGWPDSEAYRGVTRTTVHAQPPLDGHTHIKEVVRKMIAQAQKVIAVVMDVFTDVDIFRDLLDVSYKKKVSVYILLDHASVPHFLSMCQRANMHTGHLKNLRVRCCGGIEFHTHSCTKVIGHMGHRFMFIDGDKAVSGSYSFTWMSSRLDRNVITVVTGQAVDAFDRLFRFLYTTSSRLVDLQRVATEPEPEHNPVPQPASVPTPSAAVARKLYNPKYALLTVGNGSFSPSTSPGNNSPKESQKDTKNEGATKKGHKRQRKDTVQEALPCHPGLVDLEKVYLFDYLPTWPEPDPPSDVIGFINIRDTSKPNQVHLQRSEMFEVSQAIRFSSPFSMQKETLPEVATPRNVTAPKHEESSPQPQQKTPLEAITPKTKNLSQSVFDKETAKAPGKKTPPQSPAKKIHSTSANLHTPPQPVKTVTTPTGSADSPKTAAITTTSNRKSTLQNRNGAETNNAPKVFALSDSNSQIKTQKHTSNDNTSPTGYIPVTSTSVSANYQLSQATAVHSTLTSDSPTLTTISTSASQLNTNSPIAHSPVTSPPIPKPRTVQLVVKDSPGNGQKIPEVSFVKKDNIVGKVTAVDNETPVAIVCAPKETEKVPKLADKSASKLIQPKSTESSAVNDCSQEKESKKSQEVGREDAGDKAEPQLLASSKEMAKTESEANKGLIEAKMHSDKGFLKKNEVIINSPGLIIKTSDFLDHKLEEIPIRNSTVAKVQSQASSKVGGSHHARASLPQRRTFSISEEKTDLLKSPTNRSPTLKSKSDSTPTIVAEPQGDILKVDESGAKTAKVNSRSPLLSPGEPKKTVQTTDSPTSEKEPRTQRAYSSSEENLDLLNSPTNKSPILKTKSESIPTITVNSESDILKVVDESVSKTVKLNSRSPPLSPKVPKKPPHLQLNLNTLQMADSATSEKEPRTQRAYSSSGENIELSSSPTNKSPILKTKSETIPTISVKAECDVLKVDENVVKTAKLNSRSPPLSPKVPKKPAHLQLNLKTSQMADSPTSKKEPGVQITHSSSEENTDLLKSPTNRSPILKTKSETVPTIAADVLKVDESVARTAKFNSRSPPLSPRVPKKPAHLHQNILKPTDSATSEKEPRARITCPSSEENTDLLKTPTNRSPILKTESETVPTIAADAKGDILKVDGSVAKTTKFTSRSPPGGIPKKTAQLTDSTTSEKDHRTLLAQRYSPILDGFPLSVPTSDSRHSRTPEFRTPTSDVSDGCGSTTSDEFYECSESPFRESIEQVPFYSLSPLEDKDSVFSSNDTTMSSSETLNLSNKGSLSSSLEKIDDEKMLTKKNTQGSEEIGKQDDSLELQEIKDINQPKGKIAPNQSVVVEQSLTPKLNNEATEAKRMSARELKPKRVYSRAERPDKVPADGEKTGLSTSGVERRETAPSANKDPEGHKFSVQPTSVN
ncbi:microtubule-associated protein futsch isoform X2 [Periophthalmus magnuspinnatus]|uniref:microtubule-associated protein futsch isoform X2 n=1 Tax=Periophthalmus magnuspinnatus TaxID=409849 RepID=UPI00243634F7|nr:microtubule-associated protein futsch isoform X2 [Periophthalmus magnuspinnatus]XP_055079829.1 microtubule-associated protein futsch isoform X2 [Periophthalmus magnuspinnatus]